MKSESEVKQRYRVLSQRHLEKYLKAHLRHSPCNCVHNVQHEDKHGEIRLCFLGADDPENWPGNVCDTEETAQKCPFFKPKKSKEELTQGFDPTSFEDLEALQWVMDLEQAPDLSWYQRFRAWVSG